MRSRPGVAFRVTLRKRAFVNQMIGVLLELETETVCALASIEIAFAVFISSSDRKTNQAFIGMCTLDEIHGPWRVT